MGTKYHPRLRIYACVEKKFARTNSFLDPYMRCGRIALLCIYLREIYNLDLDDMCANQFIRASVMCDVRSVSAQEFMKVTVLLH